MCWKNLEKNGGIKKIGFIFFWLILYEIIVRSAFFFFYRVKNFFLCDCIIDFIDLLIPNLETDL
jgi:hypothetical protein